MTDTSQRAAAIRRGQQQALARLGQLDRQTLRELAKLYQAGRLELQDRWGKYADSSGRVAIEYLQALLDVLEQVFSRLNESQHALLVDALEAAGASGAAAVALTGVVGAHVAAVDAVWKLEQADGLQLSDRLWRLNVGAKQAIGQEVRLALVRGDSAFKAARDFLARGLAVPDAISADLGLSSLAGLSKMTGEGSALYNAQRVFRTEMNRAHTLAFIDSVDGVPGVVGYRFNLSHRHRKPDICDVHAGANLYGMGRGVYPKDVIRRICPAHPNTTSYITAVFADEIRDSDRHGDKSRIEWLTAQPESVQDSILGKQKAEWLREGKLTDSTINSRVSVLEQRFREKYS